MDAFDLRWLIQLNTKVTDLHPLAQTEAPAADSGQMNGAACVAEQALPQWSLTSESFETCEEVRYPVRFPWRVGHPQW